MLVYIAEMFDVSAFLLSPYVRCFLAFFIALGLTLGFGGRVIACLHHHQLKGQPIRADGPQSHLLTKKGTPTMGGLLILGAAVVAMGLFCDWSARFVWIGVAVLIIFGAVGFADDYLKVTRQTSAAMTARMKLLLQFGTALAAILLVCRETPAEYRFILNIPYTEGWTLALGWWYVPFAMIVIAGASNGVNLSDGLDGLASGLLATVFAVFMVAAYVTGTILALEYYVPVMPQAAEVAVMCAAVIGGCLGFLWFNAKPAAVFMGDTGALALGAFLGLVAVMLKQEILLAIAGGVFVMESISVMIQVGWFKISGKRFFKMAPIHHHFEQSGWAETKIVFRFWLVGIVLAVVAAVAFVSR